MLAGSALGSLGVSVGLSTGLAHLGHPPANMLTGRAAVEQLLAMGANRFEATDAVVRKALKVTASWTCEQM